MILAVAAAAAVGLLWLGAAPRVTAQPLPTATDAASETPAGIAVTQSDVIVHVAGAVTKPGVYTLPGGSRVGDAVSAAGGPRRRALLDGLNLARVLTDGEQVIVPVSAGPGTSAAAPAGAAPTPGSSPAAAATVSLNQATIADLETLPGIGPVLAQAIVEYRDSVGGFTDVGELRDVSGIGEKTFQALAPLVTL